MESPNRVLHAQKICNSCRIAPAIFLTYLYGEQDHRPIRNLNRPWADAVSRRFARSFRIFLSIHCNICDLRSLSEYRAHRENPGEKRPFSAFRVPQDEICSNLNENVCRNARKFVFRLHSLRASSALLSRGMWQACAMGFPAPLRRTFDICPILNLLHTYSLLGVSRILPRENRAEGPVSHLLALWDGKDTLRCISGGAAAVRGTRSPASRTSFTLFFGLCRRVWARLSQYVTRQSRRLSGCVRRSQYRGHPGCAPAFDERRGACAFFSGPVSQRLHNV